MDNLLTRHRNVSILVAVLFAQVLGLAVQVKRSGNAQDTRLIRVWAVSAITPFEKALVWMQSGTSGLWHNYVYLRGVRAENRELKQQIESLRLQQVRLSEDAEQARRLQLLLGFKEKFISKTIAAQVIGSSGSEQSRSVYIDKGSRDGIAQDQAVITADGVVGKVLHVYDSTALVLLVNDQSSGVGVILEKSRLQGVLRGTSTGQVAVEKIMSDNAVQPGERVLTSGGDQIFPKGLDAGTVSKVSSGSDTFLKILIKPAANLSKLEEVLVVTKITEKTPAPGALAGPVRAVDILTQRLPSVPDKPAVDPAKSAPTQQAVTPPTETLKRAQPGQQAQGASIAPKPATKPQASAPNSANSAGPALGKPATVPPAVPKSANLSSTTAPKPNTNTTSTKPATPPPSNVKPAVTTGTPVAPGSIKPAIVQKPAPPVAKTADKSATAPAQPKPVPAPPQDDPQ